MFNKTIDDTVSNVTHSTEMLKDDVQKAATSAGKKLRANLNTYSEEITDATEKVGSEIRDNPIRSSAIALGLGILIGAILKR
jgi:ElaB/YqjD/DUF883 family membrane-anchored ribosome-binding protein